MILINAGRQLISVIVTPLQALARHSYRLNCILATFQWRTLQSIYAHFDIDENVILIDGTISHSHLGF